MNCAKRAFTLIELIVVVALVAMLGAMLLPALASAKGNSRKTGCIYNLKQVGLAFRLWEGNHGRRYPMAVGAYSGGANEFVAHSGFGSATPQNPYSGVYCPGMAYMVMSNELATPKVLYCPSDNIHLAGSGYATNFSYGDLLDIATPPSGSYPLSKPTAQIGEINSANSKISYFVNADALEASSQDIMTGDDNIGNNGAVTASSPAAYRFGASASGETVAAAASYTCAGITSTAWGGNPYWSWTANDFHQNSGNLGMADGSCQSVTISGLHNALMASTNSASAEAINFMP